MCITFIHLEHLKKYIILYYVLASKKNCIFVKALDFFTGQSSYKKMAKT